MNNLGSYSTSYFSLPAPTLDPVLFQGRSLHSGIKTGINSLLYGFLDKHYRHADLWAHPWLAGSGVSYQWSANRTPKDLDCLVGVNFEQFRKANPEYRGLSDAEISQQINSDFRDELQPQTSNWNGFELTFYVNPTGTDIRNIKPYAAYDLKYDEWTVHPDPNRAAPSNPAWESVSSSDNSVATQLSARYSQALQDISLSRNDANKRNAETKLNLAGQQASALYDEIHNNRSLAFSPTGEGYSDFHNYRWQAGKSSGTIDLLKNIKKDFDNKMPNYGVNLPDTNTLIRRAATYRNN
jgi:hypothetical protein